MSKIESNSLYDDSNIGKDWNPTEVESFDLPAVERFLTDEDKRVLGSKAIGSDVLLDGDS
jgi:hypothetical protein